MPFTIFDPNMNKINYPVGVLPLDFLVSAIEKERYVENVNGIPGNINYGFDYKDREVSLNFWLRHFHGEHDQKLLKSELYAMLDSQPYFYVSDDRLPTRVLKLAVDEPYLPERINGSNISTLEFKCQIVGLPFWRTKYTTQQIEASGYTAIEEKYGLADGINIDYAHYTFDEKIIYVWNGGNVTIDPRNMPLNIKINNIKASNNFTIVNDTTEETFIYKDKIDPTMLVLEGTKVLLGPYNYLRNTNRKFISIKPGLNKLRFLNGEFDNIRIDFPFFYK